jgi:hypothetical protein
LEVTTLFLEIGKMSNVLQGKTQTGAGIIASQGGAADQGFKCVSRLWYPQTQPLSEGIDQLINDARKREDIQCPMGHMGLGLNDAGNIVLEYIDGREFVPTEHAFKQYATWAGVPHTFLNAMTRPVVAQNGKVKYERDAQDGETLVKVFQNGLRRIEKDKEFRFRTYTDGTLRAVLSDRYAIINNVWYLETLAELFREIGGDEPRLSHWKGDADTIYGNVLIPDTCRAENDSDYGGMISISNCEIGIRRLSQFPSIFRAICMNGCIWDQVEGSKVNKVHRGEINLRELRADIAANINDQIPLIQAGVDKFLALRDMVVAKDVPLSNVFALIAAENAMSFGQGGQAAEMAKQFVEFESNDKNLFGVINAITRTGQKYDNNDWVRFDMVAGKLMNFTNSQWEGFQARAKAMDAAQRDKVYGVVAA